MSIQEARLSTAELLARREESVEKIASLLAERRMAALDVAEQLGLKRSTAYSQLAYMADLGLAHRTGARDAQQRELWAAGRAPLRAEVDEFEDDEPPPCSHSVPACQVGMQRDPLVAALFGPAQGVEA